MEKGSGRHSTLQGRERSMFNQTNIDTVLRATLGERVWAFPGAERVWAFREQGSHFEQKVNMKLLELSVSD